MSNAEAGLLGEVYTLAKHEENVRRLKRGEITGGEWRAAYERLKASKELILAELNSLPERGRRGRRKSHR